MITFVVFLAFLCLISADEVDFYPTSYPSLTPDFTSTPTSKPSFFPTDFQANLTDLFPTEPPFANATETDTSSSSRGDWSDQDKITMAAIILLAIPALIGFSMSFTLVNRSIFRSQRLPTTSPSTHSSNHEADEVIEWELQSNALKEGKYSDKSLKKTTKTFQEWFTTSRSPQSNKKGPNDFAYSLQPSIEKSETPSIEPEPEIQPKDTFQDLLQRLVFWHSIPPKAPPKNAPQSFVINIFKEDDPFLELTVATPLDEQEDKELSFHQYLHHQALYPNDNSSYTLRI